MEEKNSTESCRSLKPHRLRSEYLANSRLAPFICASCVNSNLDCTKEPCCSSCKPPPGRPLTKRPLSAQSENVTNNARNTILKDNDLNIMKKVYDLSVKDKRIKLKLKEMEQKEHKFLKVLNVYQKNCPVGALFKLKSHRESLSQFQKIHNLLIDKNQTVSEELEQAKLELKHWLQEGEDPYVKDSRYQRSISPQHSFISDKYPLINGTISESSKFLPYNRKRTILLNARLYNKSKELYNRKLNWKASKDNIQKILNDMSEIKPQIPDMQKMNEICNTNSVHNISRKISNALVQIEHCYHYMNIPKELKETILSIQHLLDLLKLHDLRQQEHGAISISTSDSLQSNPILSVTTQTPSKAVTQIKKSSVICSLCAETNTNSTIALNKSTDTFALNSFACKGVSTEKKCMCDKSINVFQPIKMVKDAEVNSISVPTKSANINQVPIDSQKKNEAIDNLKAEENCTFCTKLVGSETSVYEDSLDAIMISKESQESVNTVPVHVQYLKHKEVDDEGIVLCNKDSNTSTIITVARNKSLEVVTQSSKGIIETIVSYSKSGNICVTTEINLASLSTINSKFCKQKSTMSSLSVETLTQKCPKLPSDSTSDFKIQPHHFDNSELDRIERAGKVDVINKSKSVQCLEVLDKQKHPTECLQLQHSATESENGKKCKSQCIGTNTELADDCELCKISSSGKLNINIEVAATAQKEVQVYEMELLEHMSGKKMLSSIKSKVENAICKALQPEEMSTVEEPQTEPLNICSTLQGGAYSFNLDQKQLFDSGTNQNYTGSIENMKITELTVEVPQTLPGAPRLQSQSHCCPGKATSLELDIPCDLLRNPARPYAKPTLTSNDEWDDDLSSKSYIAAELENKTQTSVSLLTDETETSHFETATKKSVSILNNDTKIETCFTRHTISENTAVDQSKTQKYTISMEGEKQVPCQSDIKTEIKYPVSLYKQGLSVCPIRPKLINSDPDKNLNTITRVLEILAQDVNDHISQNSASNEFIDASAPIALNKNVITSIDNILSLLDQNINSNAATNQDHTIKEDLHLEHNQLTSKPAKFHKKLKTVRGMATLGDHDLISKGTYKQPQLETISSETELLRRVETKNDSEEFIDWVCNLAEKEEELQRCTSIALLKSALKVNTKNPELLLNTTDNTECFKPQIEKSAHETGENPLMSENECEMVYSLDQIKEDIKIELSNPELQHTATENNEIKLLSSSISKGHSLEVTTENFNQTLNIKKSQIFRNNSVISKPIEGYSNTEDKNYISVVSEFSAVKNDNDAAHSSNNNTHHINSSCLDSCTSNVDKINIKKFQEPIFSTTSCNNCNAFCSQMLRFGHTNIQQPQVPDADVIERAFRDLEDEICAAMSELEPDEESSKTFSTEMDMLKMEDLSKSEDDSVTKIVEDIYTLDKTLSASESILASCSYTLQVTIEGKSDISIKLSEDKLEICPSTSLNKITRTLKNSNNFNEDGSRKESLENPPTLNQNIVTMGNGNITPTSTSTFAKVTNIVQSIESLENPPTLDQNIVTMENDNTTPTSTSTFAKVTNKVVKSDTIEIPTKVICCKTESLKNALVNDSPITPPQVRSTYRSMEYLPRIIEDDTSDTPLQATVPNQGTNSLTNTLKKNDTGAISETISSSNQSIDSLNVKETLNDTPAKWTKIISSNQSIECLPKSINNKSSCILVQVTNTTQSKKSLPRSTTKLTETNNVQNALKEVSILHKSLSCEELDEELRTFSKLYKSLSTGIKDSQSTIQESVIGSSFINVKHPKKISKDLKCYSRGLEQKSAELLHCKSTKSNILQSDKDRSDSVKDQTKHIESFAIPNSKVNLIPDISSGDTSYKLAHLQELGFTKVENTFQRDISPCAFCTCSTTEGTEFDLNNKQCSCGVLHKDSNLNNKEAKMEIHKQSSEVLDLSRKLASLPPICEAGELSHPINCDCFDCICASKKPQNEAEAHVEECKCEQCLKKVTKRQKISMKQKLKTIDVDEKRQKEEIVQFKKLITKMRHMCSTALTAKEGVEQSLLVRQRSSLQLTLSGLKLAIHNLQDKCKLKDHMIKVMMDELQTQVVDNDLVEKVLNNLIENSESVQDVDEIVKTLPHVSTNLQHSKESTKSDKKYAGTVSKSKTPVKSDQNQSCKSTKTDLYHPSGSTQGKPRSKSHSQCLNSTKSSSLRSKIDSKQEKSSISSDKALASDKDQISSGKQHSPRNYKRKCSPNPHVSGSHKLAEECLRKHGKGSLNPTDGKQKKAVTKPDTHVNQASPTIMQTDVELIERIMKPYCGKYDIHHKHGVRKKSKNN